MVDIVHTTITRFGEVSASTAFSGVLWFPSREGEVCLVHRARLITQATNSGHLCYLYHTPEHSTDDISADTEDSVGVALGAAAASGDLDKLVWAYLTGDVAPNGFQEFTPPYPLVGAQGIVGKLAAAAAGVAVMAQYTRVQVQKVEWIQHVRRTNVRTGATSGP